MRGWYAVLLLLVAGAWTTGAQDLTLPDRPASLKFAAVGDNGTGEVPEYDVGRQMVAYHGRVPFEMVIRLGDNLYGREEPLDLVNKFEKPYRPLLQAGVQFYSALGNHDHVSQLPYLPFTWAAFATTRTANLTCGSSCSTAI